LEGRVPDLRRFVAGTFLFGLGSACFESIFNNFLHARFDLNPFGHTFLELPRETPGLLCTLFPVPLKMGFWVASAAFVVGALVLFRLTPDEPQRARVYGSFPKEYRRHSLLAVFYGSRKQIFATFAPWVLVSVLGIFVCVADALDACIAAANLATALGIRLPVRVAAT
jgi:hypothetical protein